jgi:hypothetical protein
MAKEQQAKKKAKPKLGRHTKSPNKGVTSKKYRWQGR